MIEKGITVASFDVFPNSTIKPSALQRYMQQLAREDCDAMNCTYNNMRDVNMVFVLTKLGIKINEPVFAYDQLTVRTYNNLISGITFVREFEFYRGEKEVIHATTQWVIVRYDTRRIVRPREFPYEIPEHKLDCASVEIPRTLGAKDIPPCGERTVRLSDLDENDHLNNCVYSDITLDFLPYDRKDDFVSDIRIIFHHEARIGDVLQVGVAEKEEGYAVMAVNSTNESVCFEADCSFGKISR
jgi:acyl-ACP thioesterase